jgi:hypothetical protein
MGSWPLNAGVSGQEMNIVQLLAERHGEVRIVRGDLKPGGTSPVSLPPRRELSDEHERSRRRDVAHVELVARRSAPSFSRRRHRHGRRANAAAKDAITAG